jgi:hypothetical protein
MTTTSTAKLVKVLKENAEDFEFYPTSAEMMEAILHAIETEPARKEWGTDKEIRRYTIESQLNHCANILEIGAGTGEFLDMMRRLKEKTHDCWNFYAVEKAPTLLEILLKKGYAVLGTDFNECPLLDKKADLIFCNPPYSQYAKWATRIITESDAPWVFLVIPQRWKYNLNILQALKDTKSDVRTIWSGDFIEAERAARARVDVLLIDRRREKDDAFNAWFDANFQPERPTEKEETLEQRTENLAGQIATAENKIELVVNGYNAEMERLVKNYRAVCSLDEELLKEIGLTKSALQASFKQKIDGLKILYWRAIFHQFDEITSRLTYENREDLRRKLSEKQNIDITAGNIYAVLLYVCQHVNDYFDKQIINLFKRLSDEKNVIPYKSNQKVFQEEKHRWNRYRFNEQQTKYALDYRIIASSSVFEVDWYWDEQHWHRVRLGDFLAVARTMGFNIDKQDEAKEPGQKYYMYTGNKVFCEYIIYKNRNVHIKFCRDFVTALSVYVARRLGWIKNKQDIKNEFPADQVQTACKFFDFTTAITAGDCLKLTAN